ncbi:MAG TPA: serine/threonine-protein kinase [Candidatus Methylomirabilis sp.]|nr:serine/threonine-protein kinase [Candidatus Methylomirabilis sp.]
MQVGRYQIIDAIGTGANSKVVRAHDPMIGRIVAIKLFSPALAQGEGRNKFLQEARVVGQLSHPCIVTLHDMGIDDATNTPYLVMEFLEGQPLDKVLGKGNVPFPRACAWVGELASALNVAHRRGVIHGDLKPANVLILDDGRVKLTDFGMARLANHDKKDTALLGTPAYWCPEQILGRPQDARSDIFSLGVVLYELVTGQRPFDADSLQGICARVLSSKPLPVSHSNPSIPKGFDAIITRCIEKEPGLRYASVDQLAADLYPLARRKIEAPPQPHVNSFRERATRLLRSA